ncbi:MAG: NifU family protein [Candidatus Omnitrophica bacterium]|nr:NifU family protein [Candidatus Omnitrophota bacterium]
MRVDTEFTPNPNSLKFNVDVVLMQKGTAFYTSVEEAVKSSPLAVKIFEIPHIKEVFIGRQFVTITRGEASLTWAELIAPVTGILQAYLPSGQPIVIQTEETADTHNGEDSEIEAKIRQVLDEKIRPAVARDGGDIIFHGFQDGIVTLHLQGACSTCPSSIATLKAGVERILCEAIPEVREVVQV